MNIWKRNAVVATVVLFVCVALYLSWSYNRGEPTQDVSGEEVFTDLELSEEAPAVVSDPTDVASEVAVSQPLNVNYFTDSRLSRQKARDAALSTLKDLASQETLSEEDRKKTTEDISNMAKQALIEAKVEGMVVAKGFTDCVTYISDNSVNVIVASPANGLTATDVVKIQDIVVTETAFTAENIRIVEAKA